jgi:DNA polymerase-1
MHEVGLLPGWPEVLSKSVVIQKQADKQLIIPTRIDISAASTEIHYVQTDEGVHKLQEALQFVPISAVAFDSEYSFTRSPIKLGPKKSRYDIRSQRPICVSLTAAVTGYDGKPEGYLLSAVLDVREAAVVEGLRAILRLRVPFIFHYAKAELFTFWSLGLDPDLPILYDTYLAAACLNLGLHHQRSLAARKESETEAITTKAAVARKKVHLLSLVGQCDHYGIQYPLSDSKDELREAFLNLPADQPLTPRMVEYASADAEWTLRLYLAQQADILRQGLHGHLHTVEFPFAIANARMEWQGVAVDQEKFDKVRQAAKKAADYFASQLKGYGIDPPGSRDQFLDLMASLGLTVHFRRDGNLSAEDSVLEPLDALHPAVRAFRLHRRYRRLQGEEWLSGCFLGADGRLHPDHHQLGAATGRNSCSTPNLVGIGKVFEHRHAF